MDSPFTQLVVLESSAALIFGLILLWRRGVPAYVGAFTWQSIVLTAVAATVAWFGHQRELYLVAALLLAVKVIAIPRLLGDMERRFAGERELAPYVNTATSLVVAGLLVLFGYAAMRPVVAAGELPTRVAMPLAMGLV